MQFFHIFLDLDLENDLSLTSEKFEMQTNRIPLKNVVKKHIICGSTMFSSETIAIY